MIAEEQDMVGCIAIWTCDEHLYGNDSCQCENDCGEEDIDCVGYIDSEYVNECDEDE